MATSFKTFLNGDKVSTRTLLHEAIPITGSIVSGTYYERPTDAADIETNIKNYSHGLFQSVYDYPYLSSSANHIFDLTVGYSKNSGLSGTIQGTYGATDATAAPNYYSVQQQDKINIYNQMSQILVGYDKDGKIREFDQDGDFANTAEDKMRSVFFVNFSRLLVKDEIKKGSFKIQLITGSADNDPALTRKNYAGTRVATATIIGTAALNDSDGENFILTNADGTTVTFHTDPTKNHGDVSDDGGDLTWEVNTAGIDVGDSATQIRRATQALHIACLAAIAAGELKMTAVPATDTGTQTEFTLTQDTIGAAGNTAITLIAGVTAFDADDAATTAFTNGNDGVLTLQDHGAASAFKVNSPSGEYGLLYAASADAGTTNKSLGLIYYQAGIAVITSSIFRDPDSRLAAASGLAIDNATALGTPAHHAQYAAGGAFGWLPGHKHGTDSLQTGSVEAMFVSASISASCSGFRNALYNIEFNNTTELNSTIYFCRASHNEYNYSSNPTYLSESKIVTKNVALDQPVSYITSIGLYSADNELMAVAKLSEPIKKTPETELTFRVRLDY